MSYNPTPTPREKLKAIGIKQKDWCQFWDIGVNTWLTWCRENRIPKVYQFALDLNYGMELDKTIDRINLVTGTPELNGLNQDRIIAKYSPK